MLIKNIFLLAVTVTLAGMFIGCQKEPEDSAQKIHPYLIEFLKSENQQPPSYVVNVDGTWNVRVTCADTFSSEECETTINRYGIIVNKPWSDSYDVKIQKNKIYDLAKESTILFIEKTSGKTIPENAA